MPNFFKNQIKNQKGFTLLEMIVAVAIFSAVSLTAVSIFLSALQAQRRVFGSQLAQENGRFLLEMMSKELRMSAVNSAAGGATTLNITNSKGETLDYSFSGGNLLRAGERLNSDQIEIVGSFLVQKPANAPARVTLIMTVRGRGQKAETAAARINLQTTVASRVYQ